MSRGGRGALRAQRGLSGRTPATDVPTGGPRARPWAGQELGEGRSWHRPRPERAGPPLSLTCGLEDAGVAQAVAGSERLHHAVDFLGLSGKPKAPQELPGGAGSRVRAAPRPASQRQGCGRCRAAACAASATQGPRCSRLSAMLLPLSRGGTGSRGPPERCAGSSRPSAVHCRAGQGLTPAGESGAPGALGQRLTAKGMKATQGGGLAPRRGVGELHAVRQFPNPEAPAGGLLPPATPSAPAGCRAESARDGPRGHTSVLSPVTATGKDPDQGQTAQPAVCSLATGQAGAQGGGSSP